MNMTSKEIKARFKRLASFESKVEKLEHEARMLSAQFVSEIIGFMESHEINRKALADKIGISASYITQVFRGDKPMNFLTIAKILDALNLKSEVHLKEKTKSYGEWAAYEEIHTFLEYNEHNEPEKQIWKLPVPRRLPFQDYNKLSGLVMGEQSWDKVKVA